jgi:kumamolisin
MAGSKDRSVHVPLKGSRRYHRPGAQVLGRCDRHEWCEVTVKVRRKAPLPEPVPGQPISRADLEARYGADSKDLDNVDKVLTAFGLKVLSKNVTTCCLQAAGAAEVMEQAFGVHLLRVKHHDVLYRGRIGEIQIPAQLSGIVTGVFGLDTRPMVKRRKPFQLQAVHPIPPADQRAWFLPQELAEAYKFPAGDGAGQTVGILEFGGHYIASDLQLFLKMAGLGSASPEVTVRNVHTLPPSQKNDPDSIAETMLDIEVVAGVCPKANIAVYFSLWSEKGWVDNLDAVVSESNIPPVVSISYCLAEGQDIWTQQAIDHVNDSLKALANAGITVCVSSGDDGSDDQVADGQAHVSFPSSSPYVLSVGGTSLHRSTGNEVVWFEGDGVRRDGGGSTGGGVSDMVGRPEWQNFDISSVNPGGPNGRIVPDVAANAAGGTGYYMVAQNSPQVSGGTSAATPLWAALIARILQGGKQVGFLTPRLYKPSPKTSGQPVGFAACRDITDGSNKSGTAAGGYSAAVGFDATTGWGSPKGLDLVKYLS